MLGCLHRDSGAAAGTRSINLESPPATCYPGWLRIFRENVLGATPKRFTKARRKLSGSWKPTERATPSTLLSAPLTIAYGLHPTAVAGQMRPANS